MTGNDVHLYLRRSPTGNELVGRLGFRRIDSDGQAPKGLKIILQFVPWSSFFSAATAHWVWIEAEVWTQRIEPRTFGRLEIAPEQRPPVSPPDTTDVAWRWRIWPEDVEGIEREFSDSANSPRYFKLTVSGILQTDSGVHLVAGDGDFQVGVSDWEDYLRQLGYSLPPKVADLVGEAAISNGYWDEARKRLDPARKHLRAGDAYQALIACLGEFERVVSRCYDAPAWSTLTKNYPEQKATAIAGLLASHCTFLNRVGHHKSRSDRTDAGDLAEMPLTQWEAELTVASSQVLLTYALRLRPQADNPASS